MILPEYKKITQNYVKRKQLILSFLRFMPLLLIMAGGYWLSVQAWSDYTAGYDDFFIRSKSSIEQVISNSDGNIGEIIAQSSKLELEKSSLCNVSPLIKWQSFVGDLSKKTDECNQKNEKLAQLLSDIWAVTSYMTQEKTMSDIISAANSDAMQKNQNGELEKIAGIWKGAASNISDLGLAESQFRDTSEYAVKEINKLVVVWQEISNANEAKNRQQFEKATAKLNEVYLAFSRISDYSKVEVTKLVDNLYSSYEKL